MVVSVTCFVGTVSCSNLMWLAFRFLRVFWLGLGGFILVILWPFAFCMKASRNVLLLSSSTSTLGDVI